MDFNSLGNLDGLGSRRRYGGGGGPLLIEGFETISSDLPADYAGWEFQIPATAVYSLSASHVTQGAHSYKVDLSSSSFAIDTGATGYIDLTGKTSVKIDTYVDTISGFDAVTLNVQDDLGSVVNSQTFSTGAVTLDADITGFNASAILITLSGGNTLSSPSGLIVYFDNLRAE